MHEFMAIMVPRLIRPVGPVDPLIGISYDFLHPMLFFTAQLSKHLRKVDMYICRVRPLVRYTVYWSGRSSEALTELNFLFLKVVVRPLAPLHRKTDGHHEVLVVVFYEVYSITKRLPCPLDR